MSSSKVSDNTPEKKIEKLESQLEIVSTLLIQSGKQEKSKDDDTPNIFENIEKITKTISSVSASLVGLSFVFYAIGFVIVNLYLMSLGTRKFDLLNPAYFSAGIMFVAVNFVSIALSVWFTYLGYLQLKKYSADTDKFITYSSKPNGTNILLITSIVLSGFVFVVVWLFVSSSSQFLNLDFQHKVSQIGYIIQLSIFSASISVIIQYIVETREIGVSEVLSTPALFKKFRMWTSIAILLMIYLPFNLVITWGQSLYPQISPAFGGGQPITIKLVAKDDVSEKSLKAIGIVFTNGVSEPIKLIDDDESAILISYNGNAVKISKELLSNIIYLPSKTPTPTISPSLTPTALPATPIP